MFPAAPPGLASDPEVDTSTHPLPMVPRTWVERPELERLLDETVTRPLTIVVAPAGAGKTTTLSAWCRTRPELGTVWVPHGRALDGDSFARVVLTASAGGADEVPPEGDSQPPTAGSLVQRFAGRVADRLVVVDDAHLLPGECLSVLDRLLSLAPEAVRMVLLCRWDPPLDRLVPLLQGTLVGIRGEVFRMTPEQSRRLVRAHAPEVEDEVAALVIERSQGWPALVTLASLAVAGTPDLAVVAARLSDRGPMADLLADQVFSALPDDVRHLLLCLADEDEVTERLAELLSGDPGAGPLLDDLALSGLLVTRLDAAADPVDSLAAGADSAEGPAYRVHPLLREVVSRRSRAGGASVIQARAALRRAALGDVVQGRYVAGLRRLVAAEAWTEAVEVMAHHGEHLVVDMPPATLDRVAAAVPEVVEATPRAWLLLGLARWVHGQDVRADDRFRRILGLPGAEQVFRPVELALVRLLHARVVGASATDTAEAVAHAAAAVADGIEEPDVPVLRAWLLVELGAAEQWLGRLGDADHHLAWAASISMSVSRRLLVGVWSHQAQAAYLAGRHGEAADLVHQVLAARRRTRAMPAEVGTRAHVVRALLATAADAGAEPAEPASAWPAAEDVPSQSAPSGGSAPRDPTTAVLALVRLSRSLRAAGALDEAASLLESPLAVPPAPPWVHALLGVERASVAALRQDPATLERLAGDLVARDAPAEAALVRAAAHAARGRTAEAARCAGAALAEAGTPLVADTRVALLVAQAQLRDSLGDRESAEGLLRGALAEAAPPGLTPAFLGWVPSATPLVELLRRLDRLDDPTGARWLQADRGRGVRGRGDVPAPARAAASAAASAAVDETGPSRGEGEFVPRLTPRERDVLHELSRGGTYSDIAAGLFVSPNTVKTHVSAIYAKLGVTRRSDALRKARSLRLV
jgi:ATP/maltotriose-dependent transcriptional regulator MalT